MVPPPEASAAIYDERPLRIGLPLPKTKMGNQQVLEIVDRYYKLTNAV